MVSITRERSLLAGVGRPLRSREEANFQRSYLDAREVDEPADQAYVHISVTNPANYASDDAHARAIEAIGISRFPNTGISYNRLHMRSGMAYEGQPMGRRGAHTVNDRQWETCRTSGCPSRGRTMRATPGRGWNMNYNVRSYVACMNIGQNAPDILIHSIAMSIAADKVTGMLTRDAPIHGHRCCAQKDCPADAIWARMSEIAELTEHYITVGFGEEDMDLTPQNLEDIANAVWNKKKTDGTPFSTIMVRLDPGPDGIEATIREEPWKKVTTQPGSGSPAKEDTALNLLRYAWYRSGQAAELEFFLTDQNIEDIATAIAEKLPPGTVDKQTVVEGVREAFKNGLETGA